MSSKVAGLELAHWCWSSLPEEGNSFFTKLGPSQLSLWSKKSVQGRGWGETVASFHEKKHFLYVIFAISIFAIAPKVVTFHI